MHRLHSQAGLGVVEGLVYIVIAYFAAQVAVTHIGTKALMNCQPGGDLTRAEQEKCRNG